MRAVLSLLDLSLLISILLSILIISLCLPQQQQQHHRQSQQQSPQLVYTRNTNCGYDSCPKTIDNYLNIHIVCHTHLDTGWTETYDDYYYRYVRMIYNSVVQSLFEVPTRKFIVVETSFFSRWLNEQNHTIYNRVQWLVRRGQLEFISGGWSMNDEAAAHYSAIIDQMTYGHRWLNQTFGECAIPRIGWQIDPFGHSREQASLSAQMGFDGLFLGRIDYQDKLFRERQQTLEFVWKASPSLGQWADIFTGVLPNVYWPPKNFCFDVNCFDDPITGDNAERKAREFIRIAREQARHYGTDHTVITMGMDFYYRNADVWYKNLDRLMTAINGLQSREKVNIIYSTPSCYLKSLNSANRTWPIKLDDFFPYADAWNAYWTGYFTSRPSLKYLIKNGNNLIQSGKQLSVMSRMSRVLSPKLQPLQESMGILQHHDAVTGTCKQFVNDDYVRMMSRSMAAAEEAVIDSYYYILQSSPSTTEDLVYQTSSPDYSRPVFCNQLNVSECHITERIEDGWDTAVIIYNPLAHPVQHYVRLPVRDLRFRVRDASGGLVQTQIVPINPKILSLPDRNSMAVSELVFQAVLPPLGFSSFIVDKIGNDFQSLIASQESDTIDGTSSSSSSSAPAGDVIVDNGKISVRIDGRTGLLKEIGLKNGQKVPLRQNFLYYQGEDRFKGEKPSGAYAFNPSHHIPASVSNGATYKIVRGRLVDEIHQKFLPWLSQVIRLYRDYDYIEFDWIVGPIPVRTGYYDQGLEIVSKYDTDFRTNGTFFTDSNSRETIRRIRNYRPTWDLETTEQVASNYYPVGSWIFVRDYAQDLQMTVLTDRAQGGSSMSDGSIELMLHRRLLYDDGYGMDEPLNEPGIDNKGLIVRGKHRLIINGIQQSVRQMRTMSKTLTWRPIPMFRRSPTNVGGGGGGSGRTARSRGTRSQLSRTDQYSNFVGINNLLPKNIHLLTLEAWDAGTDDNVVLLRLENFYEINEDPDYSTPTDVSLRNLFTTFRIIRVQEMTLSANQHLSSAKRSRMKWRPDFDPYADYKSAYDRVDNSVYENLTNSDDLNQTFIITLKPMQIRTFLLRVESRRNCPYTGFNVPQRQRRRFSANGLDC